MNRGVIAQAGAPRELYERPAQRVRRRLHGRGGAVRGDWRWPTARCASARSRSGRPPRSRRASVRVAIRPEAWQVLAPGVGALAATVAKTAYLGSARETTFDTELGPIFVASADRGSAIQVGDAASLELGAHGHSVLRG